MTRTAPLPAQLIGRPFSVAEARAEGVSRSRLRASDLVIPTRGARTTHPHRSVVPEKETPSQRMIRLRDEMIARAREVAPVLTPEQFFSHDVGVGIIGGPLPYTTADKRAVDVSARRPAGQPRRAGMIGHRLQQRESSFRIAEGLRTENPARLWRQVGARWDLDDLIALGDHLILPRNRLVTLEDLWAEVRVAGDVPGGKLMRALREIRVGSETPEETKLRLVLVRAGLPEPELNWVLTDENGEFVARLDLAYPEYRVCPESDGRVHAFDEEQFARDADRWDAIRGQGWNHVRILSHHLRPNPSVAVRKVAEALIAAGWRPGA
ncbi:hypothetical protein ET475_14140 [Microbacterium protaetiae]|uniref:DUF559 domain-containing protein n=1 Tax=Microbacterium protaetiae TaxID=2509458 RepID=A0A4P6EGI6_9MICO|nr:hypothetical protein [Microbacterium protaetiae]QAY61016.1 hypothetical protein ET475_14140 [Microbacterium protaetiae]